MEMILYVMIWILCGAFGAYVYQQKGRARAVGLVGGLVLGPLGVVLAVMSGEKPTSWKGPIIFGFVTLALFLAALVLVQLHII